MLPYVVMLIISVLCLICEYNQKGPSSHKKYLILALIPVFVLLSFKSERIGADTFRYLNAYQEMSSLDSVESYSDTRIEIGFRYLMFVLSRIFHWPQTLLIALGMITCTSLYFFIRRTATNQCLLLFFFITLGFFQFAMSGIRQTIAISIILWAFPFIYNKKLVKFILVLILASCFHKSAILFGLAYFIANMRLTKNRIIVLFAMLIVIISSMEKILLSAAEIMEYNYGIEKTDNGYIFFAIVLIITWLALNNREALIQHNPTNRIAININFISFSLWCARLISRTVERVSLYFMPYTYLALEEYLMTRAKGERAIYLTAAVICSCILFIVRMSGQEYLRDFSFCF